MSITLNRFENGDTSYVGKHNGNAEILETAINALQRQVTQSAQATISPAVGFESLFGGQNALISEGSYRPSGGGSDLTVAAGYFWHAATAGVRRKLTSTVISFAGQSAGSYYIVVDSSGEPTRQTLSTDAAYSVVWDGVAFGAITRLANVAWGYNTFDGAKSNANLGETYQSLDPLLEAIAGAAVAKQTVTVTSADVTLTTAEAMEHIALVVSGAMTAARNLIVPAASKPYLVINNTTGGFALTVKTAAGTGPALGNGDQAVLYCDGTDVQAIVNVPSGTQSANTFYAGPSAGGAAIPTFRAMVANDYPTMVGDSGSGGTQGAVPAPGAGDAAAAKYLKADGTWATVAGASGGTVTSVALSAPAEFSVSGSPVTGAGTLTFSKANQNANLVYAGPTIGAAAPTFRALVQADLPAQPYRTGSFISGKPTNSQLVHFHVFADAVTFPSGLSGSYGKAVTAATASTVFDIQKNGTSIGSMTFAASGTSASFSMSSQTTFSAGDTLKVVAPSSADAALADITFTLAGTR